MQLRNSPSCHVNILEILIVLASLNEQDTDPGDLSKTACNNAAGRATATQAMLAAGK